MLVTNCTFRNNSGQNGGAIIASNGTTLNISFCNFDGNSARDRGGALYAEFEVYANITYSYFSNNKAITFGGTIFSSNTTTFVLLNTYFTRNTVKISSGGSIATVHVGHYYIDECNFTENSAGRQGRAIYGNKSNSFCIENRYFDRNVAELKTAVLQVWHGAIVHIKNCRFVGNIARFSRSVIAAYRNATLKIQGIFWKTTLHTFLVFWRGERTFSKTNLEIDGNLDEKFPQFFFP